MPKRLLALSVFAGIAGSIAMTPGCKEKPQPSESAAQTAPATAVPAPKKTLTIWWAQWAPADGLQ